MKVDTIIAEALAEGFTEVPYGPLSPDTSYWPTSTKPGGPREPARWVALLSPEQADNWHRHYTLRLIGNADGDLVATLLTAPGTVTQRGRSARKIIAEHGDTAVAAKRARIDAASARHRAEQAERDAVEAARHDRFVKLVRSAAQAGAEIGRVRGAEEVTVSFDDMEYLLNIISSTVDTA